MSSTPASAMRGPPMPKNRACVRSRKAVTSRAAYMSLDASPAEIRICFSGMGMAGAFAWQDEGKLVTSQGSSHQSSGQPLIIGGQSMRISGSPTAHRSSQLLLFVLQLVQTMVNSAQTQKLLMRTLFAQLSFVKHENAVSMLNCA